jgi:hypothetical protein
MMRAVLVSIVSAWTFASGAAAQSYVYGIFVGTTDGPVELIAWAEVALRGQLRMASGTLEDVPTVSAPQRILCNLPNWKPGGILIASEALFRDERAERRELPFALRPINNSALELRVADVEREDRLARLVRAVRASDEDPAYVFVMVTGGGAARFYPFRVTRSGHK